MSKTPRTDAEESLASNEALHVAYWEERGRRQRIGEAYVILERENEELKKENQALMDALKRRHAEQSYPMPDYVLDALAVNDACDSPFVEQLIAECVPAGDICDPQQVADAIRDFFACNALTKTQS